MTGLIYVMLISLWGVVLVPRWLRHHDEAKRRRQAERMERVLNPHTTDYSDERYQSWGEYLRSLARIDATTWEPVQWIETVRRSPGRQARRRRIIVKVLGALSAATVVGAVVGILPGFVAAVCTLLLAGYVSAMVWQLRQWEARRARGAETTEPVDRPTAVRMDPGAALVTDGVRVMAGAGTSAATWEPRQTTLPTYTAKAKASKIPRRIDLTSHGWTGADMVEQARAQQASPELQAQFDREFAAVEPDLTEEIGSYASPAADEGFYRRAANE